MMRGLPSFSSGLPRSADEIRQLVDAQTRLRSSGAGEADPITPPRYAEMALGEMTNHLHIVNPHQGHGQVAAGCMPDVIADFVASADPATLDASCMERAFIMPFFVDFTGPRP